MIIAIDIGNTNTGIGLIDGKKILKTESVATGFRGCYEKRMTKALRTLLSDTKTQGYTDTKKSEERRAKGGKKTQYAMPNTQYEVVVCSVSPKALSVAKRAIKKVFKIKPKVIGKDIIIPIKNKYTNPKEVGQDRLVCAYAAVEFFGAPAVVVDLGTAITFDVIDAKHSKGAWHPEYLGGMIVPGIRLSAEALYEKTALLPKIDIQKPKRLIGKTTEESILSGIFYGYGEMIKGLIDLLVKDLKIKPKIIVTGGYSDLMKQYVPQYKCIVEKELIFKGIARLLM